MEYRTGFGGERMIDTDKYEGHIPGPWELRGKIKINKKHIAIGDLVWKGRAEGQRLHIIDTQPSKCGCTDVNAQLIADAPLLLAEVKRLNAYIESIFDGGHCDIETYEEYKERIE